MIRASFSVLSVFKDLDSISTSFRISNFALEKNLLKFSTNLDEAFAYTWIQKYRKKIFTSVDVAVVNKRRGIIYIMYIFFVNSSMQ